MFLIDKYKVNNIKNIVFHNDIYKNFIIGYNIDNILYDINKLNSIIESKEYYNINEYHENKNDIYKKYNELPNLLVYGPNGSGKHTFINILLKDIFNDNIDNTFIENYTIDGYSCTSVNIEIKQSKYHLIMEPYNSGLDKYIVQNILKTYAKKKIISNIYPFRIIFINNTDNLNYYAQASLRRTMELYHKTCRFILCCKSMSKIIEPIKSRCLNISIPKLNKYDLLNYLYHIMINENIKLSNNNINKLINNSNGNVKKLLWQLQMFLYNIKDYKLSWEISLNVLLNLMISFKEKDVKFLNINLISTTRNILYNIFTTNVPSIDILHKLIDIIINSNQFDNKLIHDIIMLASKIEVRLNKGKRSIIHLDAFMSNVYNLIYLFYHK